MVAWLVKKRPIGNVRENHHHHRTSDALQLVQIECQLVTHFNCAARFDVDEVMAMGEERRSSDISRLTLRLFGLLQALKPSLSTLPKSSKYFNLGVFSRTHALAARPRLLTLYYMCWLFFLLCRLLNIIAWLVVYVAGSRSLACCGWCKKKNASNSSRCESRIITIGCSWDSRLIEAAEKEKNKAALNLLFSTKNFDHLINISFNYKVFFCIFCLLHNFPPSSSLDGR